MAAYDSPGFRGATPTGNLDQRSGTAPGLLSGGAARASGSQVGQVTVRNPFDSTADPGDAVSVGSADTSVADGTSSPSPLFPSTDGLTGTGAGDGHNLADQHRYGWQTKPGG